MSVNQPLFFLRHGETDWNAQSRYQGTTDTHLSEIGRRQVESNADLLQKQLNGMGAETSDLNFASSPLSRAKESASVLVSALSIEPSAIKTAPALREISMGRWEGLQNLEVKATYYEERKSRKTDRWHFKPEGGESLRERVDEVREFLLSLPAWTVVVTHAGILRIVQHLLGGLDVQQAALFTMPHEGLLLWKSDKTHFIE